MANKYIILAVVTLLGGCLPETDKVSGYVEGDYIYVSPTTEGVLQSLAVERGQEVDAGAPLFSIDKTALRASLASAKAELAKARAAYGASSADLRRVAQLAPVGAASKSDLDAKKAAAEADFAAIHMAEQKIVKIEKQMVEAAPVAITKAFVEDTYYRVGEYIGAGKAVVSLLPQENIKLRFFVPQAALPHWPLGTSVIVTCDGCVTPIAAKVSYIATQSEYTPPVIYSVGSRDKLVFMVEAKPDHYDPALRPGLPVDLERVKP